MPNHLLSRFGTDNIKSKKITIKKSEKIFLPANIILIRNE